MTDNQIPHVAGRGGGRPTHRVHAFTEELDLWWVRGPINAYDSGRLVAMRCEPGVGGRIIEVYDADSGEGLEVARITDWEPGRHLGWQSSLDDVRIDVRFEESPRARSSNSRQQFRQGARTTAARRSSGSPLPGSARGCAGAPAPVASCTTSPASGSPFTTPARRPRPVGWRPRSVRSAEPSPGRRGPTLRGRVRIPLGRIPGRELLRS